LPSPFEEGNTVQRSILPTKPSWYIYRFKYLDFTDEEKNRLPFEYVEVDWNTEGLPRGPNNSFITPHYDFHFYTKTREFVEREMNCENNGKTCDPQGTRQEQMGRFLELPGPTFLPSSYFPDTGSSIPRMGLHNLDATFDYTVDHVNHNPVLIYGTFDGTIAFLEASLTLFAFEDAMQRAETEEELSWELAQPEAYAYKWWPTEASLRYLPEEERFVFEWHGFQSHEAQTP
jgi:hypothetical protein